MEEPEVLDAQVIDDAPANQLAANPLAEQLMGVLAKCFRADVYEDSLAYAEKASQYDGMDAMKQQIRESVAEYRKAQDVYLDSIKPDIGAASAKYLLKVEELDREVTELEGEIERTGASISEVSGEKSRNEFLCNERKKLESELADSEKSYQSKLNKKRFSKELFIGFAIGIPVCLFLSGVPLAGPLFVVLFPVCLIGAPVFGAKWLVVDPAIGAKNSHAFSKTEKNIQNQISSINQEQIALSGAIDAKRNEIAKKKKELTQEIERKKKEKESVKDELVRLADAKQSQIDDITRLYIKKAEELYWRVDDLYLAALEPMHREMILTRRQQEKQDLERNKLLAAQLNVSLASLGIQEKQLGVQESQLAVERERHREEIKIRVAQEEQAALQREQVRVQREQARVQREQAENARRHQEEMEHQAARAAAAQEGLLEIEQERERRRAR